MRSHFDNARPAPAPARLSPLAIHIPKQRPWYGGIARLVAAQVVAILDTTGQDLARLALDGAAAYQCRQTAPAREEARSHVYRANNGQTVMRGYDSQVGEEAGAGGRSPVVEAQYR